MNLCIKETYVKELFFFTRQVDFLNPVIIRKVLLYNLTLKRHNARTFLLYSYNNKDEKLGESLLCRLN